MGYLRGFWGLGAQSFSGTAMGPEWFICISPELYCAPGGRNYRQTGDGRLRGSLYVEGGLGSGAPEGGDEPVAVFRVGQNVAAV